MYTVFFSLPPSVSLVYVSLFSGLLCVFYVLMAASFDGPRPLVTCHWQFCSLANKLRSFVRSFHELVFSCYGALEIVVMIASPVLRRPTKMRYIVTDRVAYVVH